MYFHGIVLVFHVQDHIFMILVLVFESESNNIFSWLWSWSSNPSPKLCLYGVGIGHGPQEGHSSAQLCSNPNKTHLIQLIKVFRITGNRQAGVIWSWLELNSTELWPTVGADSLVVSAPTYSITVLTVTQVRFLSLGPMQIPPPSLHPILSCLIIIKGIKAPPPPPPPKEKELLWPSGNWVWDHCFMVLVLVLESKIIFSWFKYWSWSSGNKLKTKFVWSWSLNRKLESWSNNMFPTWS